MYLSEILKYCNLEFDKDPVDFDVKGLSLDSRNVKKDYVFFSIKGNKTDGRKYIEEAVLKGARLIIADLEHKYEYNGIENVVFVRDIRKAMSFLSSAFYGNPSSKLKITGITGTNGKTTISYLIKKILEDAGYPCGLIGTISYITGKNNSVTASLTTPDSIELQKLLSQVQENGIEYCVMEVSSIALSNQRVSGINYDTAIFSNLTSEHMDLHHNMENYFQAKKILFDNLEQGRNAISNSDDEYGIRILKGCKGKHNYYSITNNSDLKAENITIGLNGLRFDVVIDGRKHCIESSLTGRFNIYNILAAVQFGLNEGIAIQSIQKSIKNFDAVKGRFNRTMLPNGACAIVDYSHTSDSLKNAIEAAIDVRNTEGKGGKIITIFGCGGDRDKTKRPVMGGIAAELSDKVIITSDNPRTENPLSIIDDILKGIEGRNNFKIEADREKAIKMGLNESSNGDIILICGKGHETYQEVNGIKSHFDDQEIVQNNLMLAKN